MGGQSALERIMEALEPDLEAFEIRDRHKRNLKAIAQGRLDEFEPKQLVDYTFYSLRRMLPKGTIPSVTEDEQQEIPSLGIISKFDTYSLASSLPILLSGKVTKQTFAPTATADTSWREAAESATKAAESAISAANAYSLLHRLKTRYTEHSKREDLIADGIAQQLGLTARVLTQITAQIDANLEPLRSKAGMPGAEQTFAQGFFTLAEQRTALKIATKTGDADTATQARAKLKDSLSSFRNAFAPKSPQR